MEGVHCTVQNGKRSVTRDCVTVGVSLGSV